MQVWFALWMLDFHLVCNVDRACGARIPIDRAAESLAQRHRTALRVGVLSAKCPTAFMLHTNWQWTIRFRGTIEHPQRIGCSQPKSMSFLRD